MKSIYELRKQNDIRHLVGDEGACLDVGVESVVLESCSSFLNAESMDFVL